MSRKAAVTATTMREALSDVSLLGDVLPGPSWHPWRILLIAAMGEALDDDERVIFRKITGREREPLERCEELWGIVGRRGGKSRAIATLAVYLACFVDYGSVVAIGERLVVLCLAQNAKQAGVVFSYIVGILDAVPMLAKLIKNKTVETLSLANGVEIEVRAAHFRGIRGITAATIIGDEMCFGLQTILGHRTRIPKS